MLHRLVILCLSVLLLPDFVHAQARTPLTLQQRSWLSKGVRHEKNGWIYLHIEGTPEERGFQHGYLLAKEIKESIRVLSEAWHYQSALDWQWLVQKAGNMFTPKVDNENIGLVDDTHAAFAELREDLVVRDCLADHRDLRSSKGSAQ